MNLASVKEGRGWILLSSLLGIGVGLAVLLWPSMSALGLLYAIAAYAISCGVIALGTASWLSTEGVDAELLTLSGLVSILYGLVMFVKPGDGALALLAMIAASSLVKGMSEVVVALGGRRNMRQDFDQLTVGGSAGRWVIQRIPGHPIVDNRSAEVRGVSGGIETGGASAGPGRGHGNR
jgi:hypothetical protein